MLNHRPGRFNAKRMHFVGGSLKGIHFGSGQFIAGALIPIRDAVDRVKGQAHFLHLGLPVLAGCHRRALHEAELEPCAVDPKPPRLMDEALADAEATRACATAANVGTDALTVFTFALGHHDPP